MTGIDEAVPNWDAPTLKGFNVANAQLGQRLAGNGGQYVRFYEKTYTEIFSKRVKMNERTGTAQILERGTRPKRVLMIHVVTPGDKNEYDDVAQPYHKREFFQHYTAFREGRVAPLGTPLAECGDFISPHVALELEYLKCFTLEQLADASDLLCQSVPNGFELREFAKAKCEANTDNQQSQQVQVLRAELHNSREQFNQLKAEMEKMKSILYGAKGEVLSTLSDPVTLDIGQPEPVVSARPDLDPTPVIPKRNLGPIPPKKKVVKEESLLDETLDETVTE